jgi:spermidine synthase
LGILVRWAASLVLITLPGLAMGASLPLLVRALTGAAASLGRRIGITYGANTIGAAIGAVMTGFWGIPAVGLRACSWAAAIASLAAALFGLLASYASRGVVAAAETPAEIGPAEGQKRLERIALAAAFVSGLVMLACELLWARVLTFVFGHDTYAFASLLALVLMGLALGGFAHRLVAHVEQATLLTALLGVFSLTLLGSYWGALSLVVARGRDPFGLEASGSFAASLWLELFRELSYTPLLVLAPSMVAGAIFATACAVFGGDSPDTGRRVGVVGLVNGVGSAAGALLSAWALVPATGIQGAFVLMALLSAAASCAAELAYPGRSRRWAVALAPMGATAIVAAGLAAADAARGGRPSTPGAPSLRRSAHGERIGHRKSHQR